MIAKSRMAKIEGKLTPQQVILNWLAGVMRRFNSFDEWAEWVSEQPGSEAPLNKSAGAAREAVRVGMKGQPKESIYRAENQAIQEAHFLVRLFLNATQMLNRQAVHLELEAESCIFRLHLRFVQLAICRDVWEMLFFLRTDPKAAAALKNSPKRLMQRLEIYRLDGEEHWPGEEADVEAPAEAPSEQADRSWFSLMTDIDGLREEIIDLVTRAYLGRDVVEAIRRNYFAGQPVLFPASARYLEAVVEAVEGLAQRYNALVPRNPFRLCFAGRLEEGEPCEDEPTPEGLIDLEEIKATVAAKVRGTVAFDVRMAQAETLVGLSMNEEGYRLGLEAFRKQYGPSKQESTNG